MSNKRGQRKKRQRQQGELDARLTRAIVQSWKKIQEHISHSKALFDHPGEKNMALVDSAVDRHITESMKFDDLVTRAWRTGHFKKILASIEYQAEHKNALGQFSGSYFDMLEAMADACNEQCLEMQTSDGTGVPVRGVIFGIPVCGSLSGVSALTKTKFIKMVRANGWVPKTDANVACLGVVTADDALALAQNPQTCWQLTKEMFTHQAARNGVVIPGKIDNGEISENSERAGGYVLLLGSFSVGEDVAAVDYPDDLEHIENRWHEAVEAFVEELPESLSGFTFIGRPCELKEAARDAMGAQLALVLQLERSMDSPEGPTPILKRAAFCIDEAMGAINLVGLFEDGTETTLAGAMPMHGLILIEDLAERMGLEEGAGIILEGMPKPWNVSEDENNLVDGSSRKSRMLH